MHARETSISRDAAAIRKFIAIRRAGGLYVVATEARDDSVGYEGAFINEADARKRAAERGPGWTVYPPIDSGYAAALCGRDQSEDRT